jgi:hypothetical protein
MSTQALISSEILRDGSAVSIRPLNAHDIFIERKFIRRLSPQLRHFRFLSSFAEPSEPLLERLTNSMNARRPPLLHSPSSPVWSDEWICQNARVRQ